MSIYVGTNYESFSILEGVTEHSNSENMYPLGLPISVHATAPEGPNMMHTSVGAMGMGQCSVLGWETVGIWDPGGSQESDDMKYVAIK